MSAYAQKAYFHIARQRYIFAIQSNLNGSNILGTIEKGSINTACFWTQADFPFNPIK